MAVPAGTVAVYMLHLMHRGGANTHSKARPSYFFNPNPDPNPHPHPHPNPNPNPNPNQERPFYFFTLMGRGIAPPGLAYTVQLDDIGRFGLCDGRVVEGCAA